MGSSGAGFAGGRCSRGGVLLGVERWLSVPRSDMSDGSGALAAQRSLLEVDVETEE